MFWQKLQRIIFVSFLVLIIGSLLVYEILGSGFDSGQARQYLKEFGIWMPLIFIVFYTIGTIFIPSTPFMAIAGILFGFKYGLLYTVIGGFLSSIIVFSISRNLGRKRAENLLENKYLKYVDKYNKRLEKDGIWDLIILRNTPIMPFNILNVLMGMSKIKTENYILGTVIGLIPTNILTVYFGDIISKIF
ncbi:MAG: TVP38/TMEM64 family protein [Patescibacteria group bacterium]